MNSSVPYASGKISSSNPSSSLWTIYFTNFKAGSPDMGSFESIEGVACPPSTLPESMHEGREREMILSYLDIVSLHNDVRDGVSDAGRSELSKSAEEVSVCLPAQDQSEWAFQAIPSTSYSCASTAGV